MAYRLSEIADALAEVCDIVSQGQGEEDLLCYGLNLWTEQTAASANTLYLAREVPSLSPAAAGTAAFIVASDESDMTQADVPNLLVIPAAAYDAALNHLLTMFNEAAREQRRTADLFGALTRSDSYQELVDACAALLGHPVALALTGSVNMVEAMDWPLSEFERNKIYETYFVADGQRRVFQNDYVDKRLELSTQPLFFTVDHRSGLRHIIAKLEGGGHLFVLERERGLQDSDLSTVELVAKALVSFGARQRTQSTVTNESLPVNLLKGRGPAENVAAWLEVRGWAENRNFIVLAMAAEWENGEDAGAVGAELAADYDGELTKLADEYVILFNPEPEGTSALKTRIAKDLAAKGIPAGVSTSFSQLQDLRAHLAEARDALFTGRLMVSSAHLYDYQQYQLYHRLLSLSDKIDLRTLCHKALAQLREVDAGGETDYYRTLYEYLDSGKDKVATAARLFIHRNTLNYRLKKIEELIGVELDAGDEYLFLYLSFKIQHLYDVIYVGEAADE